MLTPCAGTLAAELVVIVIKRARRVELGVIFSVIFHSVYFKIKAGELYL
jgi:hypothetical protein